MNRRKVLEKSIYIGTIFFPGLFCFSSVVLKRKAQGAQVPNKETWCISYVGTHFPFVQVGDNSYDTHINFGTEVAVNYCLI